MIQKQTTLQIRITAHDPHKALTFERPEHEVARSLHLLRECGYKTVTARVAPFNHIPTDTDWSDVFRAEDLLRQLGILEYATYNED